MTNGELHPHLRAYRRQHEEIGDRFRRLLEGMTPEQFNFCPAPGRWTIGQNIEHLSLEGEEQVEIIHYMLERGRADRSYGDGPFRYSRWGNWYIRFTEPPYRVRVPTLERYTAPPELDADVVAPRFFAIKEQLLELIEASSGMDLARIKAPLPYLRGWNPSLSLGQWFPYVAAHERRHLWQIRSIRSSPGYPRSAGRPAEPQLQA
jgi:hypothetical protein